MAQRVKEKQAKHGHVEWSLDEILTHASLEIPSAVDCAPQYWRTYDESSLSAIVAGAGFRIVEAHEDDNPAYSGFHSSSADVSKAYGIPCHVTVVAEKDNTSGCCESPSGSSSVSIS